MGSPGWALLLLAQLHALQRATSLSVRQWPVSLRVTEGGQATLACQVTRVQAWEWLRVEWTKDVSVTCQLLLTKGTHSPGMCGPRAQLSWRAPGDVTLQLNQLTLNNSGAYVCRVTVEIPELERMEGNRTKLLVDAGLLWPLLVAGGVAVVAVIALDAGIWGCCRLHRKDAENPLYSNVLYWTQEDPKRSKAWPGEGKVLDTAMEEQKGQGIYSTSFPQSSTHLPQPAPKPPSAPCQTTPSLW